MLLVFNIFFFNPWPCYAIRFHPSITDRSVCELGEDYPSVGVVCYMTQELYKGQILDIPVNSTGTLISLPNLDEANGHLVLVANHAFKNWHNQPDNFTFTLNGEKRRIIAYISAPPEDLIETFFCCWAYTTTLQRDFGFAVLETPIRDIKPASLCLENFSTLSGEDILTTVGIGNAGRLDSFYCFSDTQRRAMQTYVSEFDIATIESGIQAIQEETPLRLEHKYGWDLSALGDLLVRGSVENSDSGGPVFWNNAIIGITKGSGYEGGEVLRLKYTFVKEQIETLKSNDLLLDELSCIANPSLIANTSSYLIESLGGASDWISKILPSHVRQALPTILNPISDSLTVLVEGGAFQTTVG